MSKIIYQPKGKAKEYSPWAANFYNGCSNKCDYCYNRHCQAKALLGKDVPTLKKSLADVDVSLAFLKELKVYRKRILEDGKGLFFNFVSDPMLPETREINIDCIMLAITQGIPCVILTKCADWYDYFVEKANLIRMRLLVKPFVKFGFTLTGCDELEHGNSTNADRIELMKKLHNEGYRTWASIEPVIDIKSSLKMIAAAAPYCDEFKIGLLSGKKNYSKEDVIGMIRKLDFTKISPLKIQYKESVYEYIKDVLPSKSTSTNNFPNIAEQ